VARRAGISPSQLFAWKRRMLDGGHAAVHTAPKRVLAQNLNAELQLYRVGRQVNLSKYEARRQVASLERPQPARPFACQPSLQSGVGNSCGSG
jgi:transposase